MYYRNLDSNQAWDMRRQVICERMSGRNRILTAGPAHLPCPGGATDISPGQSESESAAVGPHPKTSETLKGRPNLNHRGQAVNRGGRIGQHTPAARSLPPMCRSLRIIYPGASNHIRARGKSAVAVWGPRGRSRAVWATPVRNQSCGLRIKYGSIHGLTPDTRLRNEKRNRLASIPAVNLNVFWIAGQI